MAHSTVSNVSLAGIASAVPEPIITLADEAKMFGPTEIERISQTVGVQQRHVATDLICSSDLCYAAGEKLLTELDWSRDSVDALVFVSQTGDYILPSTSCSLQDRLGLSKGCASLDINHGCTGYVYGMWVASQLLSANGIKRVLLLVGDTTSRLVSPQDRSLATLFGDAGTATALQWDKEAEDTYFELGSDGSGKEYLMVRAGGFRHPRTSQTGVRTERENNNIRSDEDLFMDGAEVFTFAIREVPPLIKRIHDASGWTTESVDAYLFHQANKFMLDYLSKRAGLPKEKVPWRWIISVIPVVRRFR